MSTRVPIGTWVAGARPRTLPAAVAPVLAGTAVAALQEALNPLRAALALLVALALQVGVNYANDYSDGIRGTDDARVGPMRLVGSGAVPAGQVRAAAAAAFGTAALAGLVLVVLTAAWWLLAVGAACIVAAWFYTGGSRPYGYQGLGEVAVFVFFGLVAVSGTTFVQTGTLEVAALVGGAALGSFAAALLMANNVRDAPDDAVAGKRTVAVRVGDRRARGLYTAMVALPYALLVPLVPTTTWWVLLGLLSLPLAARAVAPVRGGATGTALIPVIRDTGLVQLAYAVLVSLATVLALALR